MMYIHYCSNCKNIFILNGHKQECPRCALTLHELKLSFKEYSVMLPPERESLRYQLADPAFLNANTTHYRFAKHTKRFQKETAEDAKETGTE